MQVVPLPEAVELWQKVKGCSWKVKRGSQQTRTGLRRSASPVNRNTQIQAYLPQKKTAFAQPKFLYLEKCHQVCRCYKDEEEKTLDQFET